MTYTSGLEVKIYDCTKEAFTTSDKKVLINFKKRLTWSEAEEKRHELNWKWLLSTNNLGNDSFVFKVKNNELLSNYDEDKTVFFIWEEKWKEVEWFRCGLLSNDTWSCPDTTVFTTIPMQESINLLDISHNEKTGDDYESYCFSKKELLTIANKMSDDWYLSIKLYSRDIL